MCGIFGVLVRPQAQISSDQLEALLADLFLLSESRGRESAGLHAYVPDTGRAWTLKAPSRGTDLWRLPDCQRLIGEVRDATFANVASPASAVAWLGHSRLVTNGPAALPRNNQPVEYGRVTLIHNGIIVNADDLWREHPSLERRAEVDSAVMAALVDEGVSRGLSAAAATAQVFARLEGAASVAWLDDRSASAVLATNTGDAYFGVSEPDGYLGFASERYILEQALGRLSVRHTIRNLPAGSGLLVNLDRLQVDAFSFTSPAVVAAPALERPPIRRSTSAGPNPAPSVLVRDADESLLRYSEARLRALQRCTRCVLPETFPFIDFDAQGICAYCRHYRPRYRGVDLAASRRKFTDLVAPFRRDGQPDVLVAFSGGRDSSYGLHLLKTEFGLNPITFTFDWGMITDLARRNVARMCGRLGVQNILVSADIATKRDHIRRNVSAWLHRPDLGLVPIFMAGDKEFLRVANTLKRQTGITLNIWNASPLENTDFKVGCCGVPPNFHKDSLDSLSRGRQLRLGAYYARGVIANPRYLNASLADTAKAFWSYYFEPRLDFHYLYDYVRWDEREVNSTLIDRYGWETAPDTTSTWRIGDGTAAFYNYIYVTALGFSEFDTFRSNQVREGMLTREAALSLVIDENRPRPEALRWYLDTIGIDFNGAIRAINTLDTRGLLA